MSILERLSGDWINSENAEQLCRELSYFWKYCAQITRVQIIWDPFWKSTFLAFSLTLVHPSLLMGLWLFHICFGKLAQVTYMGPRFENLWLGRGQSARPLTDPCPIYRYFCRNSMFIFLKKKPYCAKSYTKNNRSSGIGRDEWREVKRYEKWKVTGSLLRIIRNSSPVTSFSGSASSKGPAYQWRRC